MLIEIPDNEVDYFLHNGSGAAAVDRIADLIRDARATPVRRLSLSDREAALLADIAESYMHEGGPAWECAPEWEPHQLRVSTPYTAEEVAALGQRLVEVAK